MAKTELRAIEVEKIKANPEQPRELFDRDKLRELSNSIKEIGLINPITVRKKGKGYEIVAGERRWRAHQIAKMKKVPALVKNYNSEGQVAVESLIENVHREGLMPLERAKFLKRIAEMEKIFHTKDGAGFANYKKGEINSSALARRVGMNESTVKQDLSLLGFEPSEVQIIPKRDLVRIATVGDEKLKKKILEIAKTGTKTTGEIDKIVSITRTADKKLKEALLNNKITTNQAEDLIKINSTKAREKALLEVQTHKRLSEITPKLMERSEPEFSDAAKKKFNSAQKTIFIHLSDARIGLIKAEKELKKANQMLVQLMEKQFEYALTDKTLSVTATQMNQIADSISNFNIQTERYEELKDTFVERVENKESDL